MKVYIAVLVFILFDIATGIYSALATGTFNSSKMRDGLFKKVAEVFTVAIGTTVDYFQQGSFMPQTTGPIAIAVCGYIIFMEIGSCIENIGKVNPALAAKMKTLFAAFKDKDGENK